MAFDYCAQLSLPCARFLAKHRCSSSLSSPWFQLRLGGSPALHLPEPNSSRVSIPVAPCAFSLERRNSPRLVRAYGLRRGEIDVATGDSWEDRILKSDIPVLVEFWAAWCGPCRMVHRELEEIAIEYDGKVNCFMLKVDDDPEVAETYGIKAVPVVMFFKNGEKQSSVTGTMPKDFYVAEIEKLLASSD